MAHAPALRSAQRSPQSPPEGVATLPPAPRRVRVHRLAYLAPVVVGALATFVITVPFLRGGRILSGEKLVGDAVFLATGLALLLLLEFGWRRPLRRATRLLAYGRPVPAVVTGYALTGTGLLLVSLGILVAVAARASGALLPRPYRVRMRATRGAQAGALLETVIWVEDVNAWLEVGRSVTVLQHPTCPWDFTVLEDARRWAIV